LHQTTTCHFLLYPWFRKKSRKWGNRGCYRETKIQIIFALNTIRPPLRVLKLCTYHNSNAIIRVSVCNGLNTRTTRG
jgi:hypothetical protein